MQFEARFLASNLDAFGGEKMQFVSTYLAESCIRHSEDDALYCNDETISYHQLAVRVEHVCQLIRDKKLSGQQVLIHLPKSIDYVVAIYAVLATGNCYVPVDASQPLERAKLILEQARPALVITESSLVGSYTDETVPTLAMDTITYDEAWLGQETLKHAIASWYSPNENDIAAILFTSGSTGTPKGVQISHGMLNHFIEWAVTELELSSKDVFSNHASYAFDLSTFDLFASSRVGAAVWVITKEQQHDVSALLEGIERFNISIWYSVPTVLSMLVASGEFNSQRSKQLRHVLFAGEPYPIGALRKLCECLPSYCQLSNWYGPTETNVCFSYRFSPASTDLSHFSTLPIGRPLPGLRALIIDEQGVELSDSGEQGELLIEGAGVTPGYSNIIDPRNSEYHRHRCHATGDIVHCDQGLYYFHGRSDDLVKVNGHRVELGEIEACLGQMSGIKDVAVIAKLGEQQQKLIANIVIDDDRPKINLLTVKQFVSQRLPRYMVPHAVRFLPALPVNANGKVDRKYLRNEV